MLFIIPIVGLSTVISNPATTLDHTLLKKNILEESYTWGFLAFGFSLSFFRIAASMFLNIFMSEAFTIGI